MEPCGLEDRSFNLNSFQKYIKSQISIKQDKLRNHILLIERSVPDSYYIHNATIKGASQLRRSIVNHEELATNLKNFFPNKYKFQNLTLEDISLEEQIKLFSRSCLVIGQHGAGLSNIIWMKKNSVVIEFGFKKRGNFARISSEMKHKYYLYESFEDSHITININHFIGWMTNKSILDQI